MYDLHGTGPCNPHQSTHDRLVSIDVRLRPEEEEMAEVLTHNLSILRYPFLKDTILIPLVEGYQYSLFLSNWAVMVYDEMLDDIWLLGDGTPDTFNHAISLWNEQNFSEWREVLKDGTITDAHPVV
jgi:hypothetical protein